MFMNKWLEKYIIGLTGNICAGKTVVCGMLKELGAAVIDADSVTHDVLKYDSQAIADVGNQFGMKVIDRNGVVDRKKLGNIVFDDAISLKKLETLLHPLIRSRIEKMITECTKDVIVIEAIKLLESGLSNECDSVWVVNASIACRMERLMKRDNISATKAEKLLYLQGNQESKNDLADVVIDNDISFENTRVQVRYEWGKIVVPE